LVPDNIDPAKKAAIMAAVAAFMGSKQPKPAMFLRDCKDGGPWGKLSRTTVNAGSGYRARKG